MSDYKQRVAEAIEAALPSELKADRTLDFGSGDGWYWDRFDTSGRLGSIQGIDVQRRDHEVRPPELYDGVRLPFDDDEFDVAYSIDVIHHCPDPVAALKEIDRVASDWLVIKDHTYRTPVGFAALSVLDEIGNRKFGIPSRYRYQHRWAWLDELADLGWSLQTLQWPLDCNGGAIGVATRRLNFLAIWERT